MKKKHTHTKKVLVGGINVYSELVRVSLSTSLIAQVYFACEREESSEIGRDDFPCSSPSCAVFIIVSSREKGSVFQVTLIRKCRVVS